MKKIIFIAVFSLVSMFCVAAPAAEVSTTEKKSTVTAIIPGVDEEISFGTKTLATIYSLMPQKVKKLCVSCYKSIAPRIETSIGKRFVYEGVSITPTRTANGISLKFSYKGHSVIVDNYTKAEFDKFFGL
ncbi:MAG: hypothetical protein IKZ37_03745 [Bacteroidaceae bacterium]|nr:hypothetical protein [Bacteroidaceae bacterium]